jgi:hypothetical protein
MGDEALFQAHQEQTPTTNLGTAHRNVTMGRTSDLVQDSELHTYFLPDHTVETVHTFQVSDPASGQRLVTRKEHWQRQKEVGSGGFGSVWLEKCIKGGRSGDTAQSGALRAVKQIDMDPRHGSFDYNRELEAITKFSHYRVSLLGKFKRRKFTDSEVV